MSNWSLFCHNYNTVPLLEGAPEPGIPGPDPTPIPPECYPYTCDSYNSFFSSNPSIISGYWPLGESSGPAIDSSGNGFDLGTWGTPLREQPLDLMDTCSPEVGTEITALTGFRNTSAGDHVNNLSGAVGCLLKPDASTNALRLVDIEFSGQGRGHLSLNYGGGADLNFFCNTNAGGDWEASGADFIGILSGIPSPWFIWVKWTLTSSGDGMATIYVNGEPKAAGIISIKNTEGITSLGVGSSPIVRVGSTGGIGEPIVKDLFYISGQVTDAGASQINYAYFRNFSTHVPPGYCPVV